MIHIKNQTPVDMLTSWVLQLGICMKHPVKTGLKYYKPKREMLHHKNAPLDFDPLRIVGNNHKDEADTTDSVLSMLRLVCYTIQGNASSCKGSP